jgi:hypothetical protein
MKHVLHFRKQHFREVKLLQREEQKQGIELISKIRRQWDAQEQKFDFENAVCLQFFILFFVRNEV